MSEYDEVRRIFFEVCELPPDEREAALASKCGGDEALRAEVASLLSFDDADADVLPGLEVAQALFEEPDAPTPEMIGEYRIVRRLGGGGMADVFEAEQVEPRRRVAVKVLRAGFATETMLRRFQNERQILASLDHPLIAKIYDGGVHRPHANARGIPYFVMELIEGEPLTKY